MKRKALMLLLSFFILTGCAGNHPALKIVDTVETPLATYCEMSDGTFQCDGYTYQYCLRISGRMPNAVLDSTFVYLSNLEEIPFDRAWLAAGLSSYLNDYFSPEEAILVDWINE